MKVIRTYSDNLEEPIFEGLLLLLSKRKQTLDYYDACAKRMARYAKKSLPLRKWPRHIRDKYNFVTSLHNEARQSVAYTI